MTSCDTNIDWGSSKEEIVDDKDDDEGLQKSYDVDLSLEIDNKDWVKLDLVDILVLDQRTTG
jgi:hypothetical protein